MASYPLMPHEERALLDDHVNKVKAELSVERGALKAAETKRSLVEMAIQNPHPAQDPVDVAKRAYEFITDGLA